MKKLEIPPKTKRTDNYKNVSIRIKSSTIKQIDEMARLSNRSRSELINILLEFGTNNCTIQGSK